MKELLIFLLTTSIGLSCLNHKYSDMEKEKIILGLMISTATGTTGSAISCTTNYTYSSLSSTAGLSSKCSSCHSASTKSGGYDVTSYSETIKAVSGSSPESSLLYTKVNGGSMASYSDTTLNNAIYCWIKSGVPQ